MYNDADGNGERHLDESYVRYLYTKNRLSSIWTNTTRYSILTDLFGNTTAIKAGTNTLATYEYAPNNGKLLKMTYGNGDYEEYVYDKLDRLVETKYNGTVENTVKYNANGAVSEITDGDVTHIYKYDSLGRLIRAYQKDSSGNVTMAVENSYDELGRAKGSTYVVDGKTLSYTLSYTTDSSLVDSVLLPKSESVQSSLGYTYDEFDRLVKKNFSFSTGKTAYEEYDYYSYVKDNKTHTTALVSSLYLVSESGTDIYNYTYDALGNILTVSKNGAPVESYEYDSLNQLTRENNLAAGYTKLYSYDPMGNITSKVELPFTLAPTASLDTSNGTVTSYGYASGGLLPWGDMLVNYNGTAITYDNIGNPLNWRNASEFVWSARELVSANLSNGNTVSYTYNADGIRTQKVYNGTTHNYILDGSKIIKEEVSVNGNTSYELYYIYDASGSVIGFHYNNNPYYFLKNLQGDVVSIVNAMGTVVVEYTYDAWGKLLSTTGTLASTIGAYNPFRYRGYYYDSETGWYYLQSRYYDPVVGRFLNADGYVSTGSGIIGHNMYAYCDNNPVMNVDVTGDCCICILRYIFSHLIAAGSLFSDLCDQGIPESDAFAMALQVLILRLSGDDNTIIYAYDPGAPDLNESYGSGDQVAVSYSAKIFVINGYNIESTFKASTLPQFAGSKKHNSSGVAVLQNGIYSYSFNENMRSGRSGYHITEYGTGSGKVPAVRWDSASDMFKDSTATGIYIHSGGNYSNFNSPWSMGCILVHRDDWDEFVSAVGGGSGTFLVYGPNRY